MPTPSSQYGRRWEVQPQTAGGVRARPLFAAASISWILREKSGTSQSLKRIGCGEVPASQTLQNANYLSEVCTTGWFNHYLWVLYYWCSKFWSSFTCSGLIILLLFMISHTGHADWGVETIANSCWLVETHLLIFVPLSLRCQSSLCLSICKQINMVYNCYGKSLWLLVFVYNFLNCDYLYYI